MKNLFKKVLLLSNTSIDMGTPDFRSGAYTGILIPMAKALEANSEISTRIIANSHINQYLKKHAASRGRSPSGTIVLDEQSLRAANAQNFAIDSYKGSLESTKTHCVEECILKALNGWIPDVVISWESPTFVFRSLFPDALILDIMPGMFMRPPFPRMLSFDPVGLYKNCWYAHCNLPRMTAPSNHLENHIAIRKLYEQHYNQLHIPEALNRVAPNVDFEKSTLVPLQISDYFSWKENTDYTSQFELIEDIQANAPPQKNVVYTQYTGSFISEHVINSRNIDYLRNQYQNFVYAEQFEKIDNITQYMIPCVDSVVSIASTLGLQAKFFGKRLISPSRSNLSYIADGTKVEDLKKESNASLDGFMANYLGRTNFLMERIINEYGYLVNIINGFIERQKESSIEQFPSFEEVGNSLKSMAAFSALKRSKELFKTSYPRHIRARDRRIESQHEALKSAAIKTVSFDVFDTLVCRTVLKPTDVFELIQSKLYETHLDALGENFISSFARMREGTERLIRIALDSEDNDFPEEMKISDVYENMLKEHGLSHTLADELVTIEQDLELSCLIPRNEVVQLFYAALSEGKQVIIISDFIHPSHFVERVLRKCGIDGWEKIYVSSEIGLKKHTGSLFGHVEKELGLTKSETLHFGDNPHGDIKMGEKNGWKVRRICSGPSLVREQLKKQKIDLKVINSSFIWGAVLSGFANEFFGFGASRCSRSKKAQLIANPCELGFLTIGPIMYFFSKWLIKEAQKNNCEQIVFFARDSLLPYKIITRALEQENRPDIRLCYLPVSRLAVSGLDIRIPTDVYKVRIDDFSKSKLLIELFECRFHFEKHEVDLKSLSKWTNKRLSQIKVEELSVCAIYQVAQSSVKNNWNAFSRRLEEKRDLFRRGLKQWGCDTDLKTLSVDFGYKGSIHRKIEGFFKELPLARFFMSYANTLGREPIPHGKAFFLSNQIPCHKANAPLIQYNLLIETMINEGVGSALGYHETDGKIEVLREDSVDSAHAQTIKELHNGALRFSEYWMQNCKIIDNHASIEPEMLSFIFHRVLVAPTSEVALMLSNLSFDNGYAGHRPKKIIEIKKNSIPKDGLWREGLNALKEAKNFKNEDIMQTLLEKNNPAPTKRNSTSEKQKKNNPNSWRIKTIRFFVGHLCSDRLLNKFDRDPFVFFTDSSRRSVRYLSKMI